MRRSRGRTGGQVDVTDVVVGLALVIVIPVVAIGVLTVSGVSPSRDATTAVVNRKERVQKLPPTARWLRDLHATSTRILDEGALFYLKKFRGEANETAKIFEARWATRCLEKSQSGFTEFLLATHNGRPAGHPADTQNLATVARRRLEEIQAHVEEIRQHNTLDLDL